MSSTLISKLPSELYGLISEHLSFRDRLNFSATHSILHGLLGPTNFTTLRFNNREEDAEIVRSLIAKYRSHVRMLHFQCYLYPDVLPDEEENATKGAWFRMKSLPDWMIELLSGKTLRSPEVYTIQFIFSAMFASGDDSEWGSQYVVLEPDEWEDYSSICRQESEKPWRRVLCQAWRTLMANDSVRELEVLDLVPCEVSAWYTEEATSFLRRLQKLSVMLRGMKDVDEMQANIFGTYLHFQSRLGDLFLEGAENITDLSIIGDPETLYGSKSHFSERVALSPKYMPRLRVLRLENCILDPNIVEFLRAHAGSLKQLTLLDCLSRFSIWSSGDVESPHWAGFFRSICDSKPILEDLKVTNKVVPLADDEEYEAGEALSQSQEGISSVAGRHELHDSVCNTIGAVTGADEDEIYDNDSDAEDIRRIRDAVRAGDRKLFGYMEFDSKYGYVSHNAECNVERFKAGDDQQEYDALRNLLLENKIAAARDE